MRYPVEPILDYLVSGLSSDRFAHCRSTAFFAARLCRRYGLDEERGYVAGLAHDIAREWEPSRIGDAARADLGPDGMLDPIEESRPVLAHGRAAAWFLREHFGVTDRELLDAIRDHTLGRPGMNATARVLYLADYLEPLREHVAERDRVFILSKDLDGALREAVHRELEHNRERGRPLAARTEALYHELIHGQGKPQ